MTEKEKIALQIYKFENNNECFWGTGNTLSWVRRKWLFNTKPQRKRLVNQLNSSIDLIRNNGTITLQKAKLIAEVKKVCELIKNTPRTNSICDTTDPVCIACDKTRKLADDAYKAAKDKANEMKDKFKKDFNQEYWEFNCSTTWSDNEEYRAAQREINRHNQDDQEMEM